MRHVSLAVRSASMPGAALAWEQAIIPALVGVRMEGTRGPGKT